MKNNKVTIPISIGELFDKISILQIKLEKIKDKKKLKAIKKEFLILKIKCDKLATANNKRLNGLFKQLLKVNKGLWHIEDNIRMKEKKKEFDNEFIELARSVYYNNDKRSFIKSKINIEFNSDIVEIKEYSNY